MKVYVKYEDTENEYDVPFDRLLKLLQITPAQLERAVLKALQES